jgi:hypothetical protein
MEEVISQAPEHISKEIIESVFKKNNEIVIDTLVELWEIEVPLASLNKNAGSTGNDEKTDIHNIKDPEEKWTAIRNICDSYDIEMQAQLNRLKERKYNNT